MKINPVIAGVALALAVAAALPSFLLYQSNQLNAELQASRMAADAANTARIDQLMGVVDSLRTELLAAQQQMSSLQLDAQLAGQGVTVAPTSPQSSIVATPLAGLPADSPLQAIVANLQARSNNPAFRDMMLETAVNGDYGDFINSLGLSRDDREKLVELMKGVVAKQQELSRRLAAGEISRDQFDAAMKSNQMADTVAGFLSKEEMDVFYDFEADRPNRQRQRLAGVQSMMLNMEAPGLTPANRDLVAQTLTQSMEQMRQGSAGTLDTTNMQDVYDRAEQTLQGQIDPSQMEIVHDFLKRRAQTTAVFIGPGPQ